jgi:hypothetical protein
MERVLYVRLTLSTDLDNHDAFYPEADDGLSWAATWLDTKLSNEVTEATATVYSSLADMVLDEEEVE